ncbi:alpha/beta hydrolase [Arachnia propionica]|uniref:Alpha/beta hydrolase n=2 Tax=Arachnia propionica TaxID=1750 RepID=A0A3P1T898_9ACTN|nr:alpha/beta hydrolase [Arachnia propionica]
MPMLTTPDGVSIHHTDQGRGRPLVLIHGWPLSGAAFEDNTKVFVDSGYRVITYDRRGFGTSDRPEGDYSYDTLAADLDAVLTQLDLRDAVLLGFSMGGGEVARYLATRGSERVAGAILSGSICPALCITDDNPDGAMPLDGFQGIADSVAADHHGFVEQFCTWFFSNDDGLTVDEQALARAVAIARQSAPHAAAATVMSWATDLRQDCRSIDVPLLVIHGDGDQNVPLAKSSARVSEFAPQAKLVVIKDGPHGVNVSHADHWNRAILDFLATLDG